MIIEHRTNTNTSVDITGIPVDTMGRGDVITL